MKNQDCFNEKLLEKARKEKSIIDSKISKILDLYREIEEITNKNIWTDNARNDFFGGSVEQLEQVLEYHDLLYTIAETRTENLIVKELEKRNDTNTFWNLQKVMKSY